MALGRSLASVAALAALVLGAEAEERPVAQSAVSPVPTPPQRPEELKPPQSDPPVAPDAAASEMPQPPPRPPELSSQAALPAKVQVPDDTACRRRLERLGATFEALPPIANGQCGAGKPLKVTALAGVVLPTPVTLVCGAAEALARWTVEVQVAAERDLGHPLASLSIGTSYECRGQNHDPDARLSEHAVANGIDVMGYGFTGRGPIGVIAGSPGTPEATFQSAIRGRACGLFRTVLGPGSDAAHANHLHLDERERNSGHRLCQ